MRAWFLAVLLLVLGGYSPGWIYRIAWDYDSTSVHFHVLRCAPGSSPVVIGETQALIFRDETAVEGAVYQYTVIAVGPTGAESNPSDPLEVITGYRGDCNRDGVVDFADWAILARYMAQLSLDYNRRMDLNDDGVVDSVDLVLLGCRVSGGSQ